MKTLDLHRWELLYFLFFLMLLAVFWFNAVTFNDNGSLVVGLANLWADWAAHFTMGSAMAYRELVPSSSPLLSGAAFSYPFGVNWISAVLIRLGVPFHLAFVIPSFIFSVLLIIAVYVFFRVFLRSRYLALFAAVLFFFNGGIGIYYYLVDVMNAADPLATLIDPPRTYTSYPEKHLKWISVFSSMIFPQRAFAPGVGVCLLALSLIFHSFRLLSVTERPPSWRLNVPAGILLGVLPLLHAHSFLAAFIILSFWFIADLVRADRHTIRGRLLHWLVIVAVTSSIALPIILTYFTDNLGGHFLKWFPGWYAKEFGINWFVMWFKNWTLVPFLGFIGFVLLVLQQPAKSAKWHAALIIAPGALLFIVPNLILTQPWLWDNTKLFIWASIFLSPMAAFALYRLCGFGTRLARVFLISCGVFMCSSGFLDTYYAVRTDLHSFTMYNKNELELAAWTKANTASDTIWLTSTRHNHWLFNLTGRQALITYPGWLWSHGYDYHGHERDAKKIFSTGDQGLIENYGINYIVYDSSARKDMQANKSVLDNTFEVVKQLGQYTIYKTRYKTRF